VRRIAESKGIAQDCVLSAAGRNTRACFLETLFGLLDEQGVRYCVLHAYHGLPNTLPSDLDLAVYPEDAAQLPIVFQKLSEQGYRPVQCLNYAVNGYYFVFFWFDGPSLRSAAVDIIYEHREGGLILLPAEALIAGRQKRGDFWIPAPGKEFAYLLAKKILKGNLPDYQARRLKILIEELGESQAEEIAGKLFGAGCKSEVVEACKNGHLGNLLVKLKRRLWWSTLKHDPLNPLRNLLGDGLRRVRRWLVPTGLLLAVLGPDRTDKSTLIERLTESVGPAFRRNQIFQRRPHLLWPKESCGPKADAQGQAPRSTWSAIPRLFALLVDYWLGYLLLIRPLLVRSGLLVFDRYFNDLLVDPERNRYRGPRWLVKAICPLVPTPHLILVFDGAADSDRGIEQTLGKQSRLIAAYLADRFQHLHGQWLVPKATIAERAVTR
jgi:hypothetical protein